MECTSVVCRVSGGGAIFSVGKKDSDNLREIWDGSRVSGASVKPPLPPTSAHTRFFVAWWNVGLVSSSDCPKEMVKHCLTSLAMFLRLSDSISDDLFSDAW